MPKSSIKHFFTVISLIFLSASCSLFGGGPRAAGIVKTVNGGADWQFSNAIKDNKDASLSQSNIAKLAFDPQNREIVYAGSYSDGLYKSEDSGGSWSRILSKISVYDFVVHPTDGKIIYAAGIFANQGKVLKTTDGGASWQEVYNESAAEIPVRGIDLNPADANQIVIGTSSGNLIKSADAGLSWQLAVDFADKINQVIWRKNGIYAVLETKGIHRGSNAADAFQDITAPLTKNSNLYNVYNSTALSFNQAYVDPISSSLLYLTGSHGLYKSTDSGANWTQIALPTKQGQSFARPIAVAQTSSNVVLTSVGPVIYKSTNGGTSWQTQNIGTNGYVNYILVDPSLPQIAYAGTYVVE